MRRRKIVDLFSTLFSFFGGAALFGVAMNMFLSPGKVVMGGITGISATINYMFPQIPIGITIMVINIPLLFLNMKAVGTKAMLKTIAGIVASSVMIDLLTFLPVGLDEPLLCALFGGAVMGSGAGLMLSKGYTTGGSDLAAFLLKRRVRNLTTGRIILFIDILVITGSAFAMKDFNGIIYSAVSIFAYSVAIDAVMGGSERAKLVIIISSEYQKIATAVSNEVHRGVTLLHGSGYYTGENKEILMCVVKRHEEYQIKTIVEEIDPVAFMIFSDATEVLGMGFKKIEPQKAIEGESKKKKEKTKKRKNEKVKESQKGG